MAGVGVAVALVAVGCGVLGYRSLRASLPVLTGEITGSGLRAPVTVARDAQGIPLIEAASRRDVAWALGFLHAQERFFQMDTQRRFAAGELAELVGDAALPWDREVRLHRLRVRAKRALEALPPKHRTLAEGYTEGVNRGLEALGSRPFEYLLLRRAPTRWRPEDTLLCIASMYLDLQSHEGTYERSLDHMRSVLPGDWFAFLRPQPVLLDSGGQRQAWEAPIAGDFNTALTLPTTPITYFTERTRSGVELGFNDIEDERDGVGSNNWGVAGSLSSTSAAMVADDMHLGLRVPNIWYRASWRVGGAGPQITGATLPGTPGLVIGSNEHIAWGFTNSFGDWSDVVRLRTRRSESEYLTPQGWQSFAVHQETLRSPKGTEQLTVRETIWGPVIGRDPKGRLLAYRWVAHDPEGINLGALDLERARSVDDALKLAPRAGIPAQNLVVGDRAGRLAWTIMGPIPRRTAPAQEIQDWSAVSQNWTTYLTPEEYPVVDASAQQRLWTANARVLATEEMNLIGDGGYDIGIRAGRIRERLFEKDRFDEGDLLAIQLDTHNNVLERWQPLLEKVLRGNPENTSLAEMKKVLASWDARAEPDEVAYGVVRAFRAAVLHHVLEPVLKYIEQDNPEGYARARIDNHWENPVWTMLQTKSSALLNPVFPSWEALLQASAEQAYGELTKGGRVLGDARWETLHPVEIRHPLSRAVPLLSWLVDMPAMSLPGDRRHVVRIQGRTHGASQRMVVSPGHESQGVFHMATGQSAHPLSPFYDAGHRDWVEGRPSSFLPGPAMYTLTLTP